MRRLGVPRRTLAITAANSLSAAGHGQFMFVLPWMLLSLGYEPRDAALATAFVYVPLLVSAVPAGLTGDNVPPLRVLRISLGVTLAAAFLYPLGLLAGVDAARSGSCRPCCASTWAWTRWPRAPRSSPAWSSWSCSRCR